MNDTMVFKNQTQNNMSFEEVFTHIADFIKNEPENQYVLAIGTDSQVRHKTHFITAIHIHRVGKGVWACYKEFVINRHIDSVKEKISMETTLSQEVAFLFTPEKISQLIEPLIPYADKGADFKFEVHIDIGRNGLTKYLIQEMVGRIYGMGIQARIKPDSYCASCYANKYTKKR